MIHSRYSKNGCVHVGEAENPSAQFTWLGVSEVLTWSWTPKGFLESYWALFYVQRLKTQGSD